MFLSAAEIANAQLPGLSTAERAIKRMAEKKGWQSRPRAGRGGGLEYALDSLPAEARAAYVAKHIEAVEIPAAMAREAAAEPEAASVTGGAANARDARLALLGQADRIAREAGIGHKRADRHLCDLYNTGGLDIAPWIRDEVKNLHPRTLARWRAAANAGHKSRLGVDRGAARRGTGVLDRANDGQVRTHILALVAKQPQLTAHHIRSIVADAFPELKIGDKVVQLPPIRTFQAALNSWKATYRVALEQIRNPDNFKSTMRFSARVANPASRLNEIWQIDASPADVMTTEGRRQAIYVCEDIYSRRLVALVTSTPRAEAVGLLIRKAILLWGVPERIKTDNGSDFIAHATRRLFAALGIDHETSAPFSPEQKGHVERAIGTLQRDLMRTLPGFIGHSVADRKVIENRKAFSARLGEAPEDTFQVALSAAELQAHLDTWCRDVYGTKPHASLKGRTPFEMAAMAVGGIRKIEDVRALDMLLAPVAGKNGLRTVTKTGLRINDTHYIGGFLDVGETVFVRMDPADMGRAYVYTEDGDTYLGEAIAPELAGVDPAEAISRARAEQKRVINDSMAEVKKAARRIKAKDFAPAIQRQALLAAGNGKLIEFPKPVEAHDTPALAAASAATTPIEATHAPEIAAIAEALRSEPPSQNNVQQLRPVETERQLWNRARALEARIAAKEFVEPDELLWLGHFREGSVYRGFLVTYGDEIASPDEVASSS
ncbi:DDE-type integrase/transposase/recombinase [Bradyrhizobium sp. BR 10289]|uniref:DDE-type integrase/transposase/recombinase n=1 Tax=Bradyrhizobium sp. BR 10289 TaxID=2749993 RepID=UPI001C652373|nr:DDE-type integrase/transposase/recombinase [Bradyrhizobium sp. BR 10289]MBW7968145.1 DDE-type integrase/transposase/recombinase [Bradyrhizobium sp. BR 10289]